MKVAGEILVLLLLAGSVLRTVASTQATLTVQDAAVVDELYHLWSEKAGRIWPGASETKVPVLYIKSDTEYAIAFPEKMKGFVPLSTLGEQHRSVQARPRTLATDLSASSQLTVCPPLLLVVRN